ncbi:EamA family transporter [Camelimonas sp. ID_303_24]
MQAFFQVTSWQFWALLSAVFAALTAILAKVGVSDINADLATFIRTVVILAVTAMLVTVTGQWRAPTGIPLKTWALLALSGVATGLSWLCYFRALKLGPAAQVAPVDKLSVVLTTLFAISFLGERISLKAALGVALIAAGVVLTTLK